MLKKYKKLPLILTGLAGVALLTTGFSAWVISGGNAESSQNITITVGEVTDNRPLVKAELTATATDGKLTFDSNANGGSGPITGNADNEDMEFGGEVVISVGKGDYKIDDVLDSVKFELAINDSADPEAKEAFSNAITKGDILSPITLDRSIEYTPENWNNNSSEPPTNWDENSQYLKTKYTVVNTGDGNQVKIGFTFGFCWGSVFKHKNPVDISSSDDVDIDDVVSALNALQSLNGVTDLLTLTVTPIGSVKDSA